MAGAAELGRSILTAMAGSAAEVEERMRGGRPHEGVETGVGAPGIEHFFVVRRIRRPLQLSNAVLGVLALFGRRNPPPIQLLLNLLRHARRFFLRLEAGTVDGAVTGHAAVDPRHAHVVHLDVQIGQNHLIDLERRGDEVEHRRVEHLERAALLDGQKLFVEQVHRRGELLPFGFRLGDLPEPLIDARPRRVAVARHILQPELQVVDVLILPFVLGQLLGGVLALLHHRGLGVVALCVEAGFGEAIVLVRRVVLSFPGVDVLLRQEVLLAVACNLHLIRTSLNVEIGELHLVGVFLRHSQILLDPLPLHAQKLALEPLPAADIVVAHDQARGHQQSEACHGEDQIQSPHGVVMRNGLLWFHGRTGVEAF